ncbi:MULTISPECIES: HAMP domain-containing sensor histidine kinase [unclassified Cupriavidus]|uniref:sensor histidine kinase n=1 Tax=unclassified Cupriavidus TaxID=2640874 RepID=UPI001F2BDA40|nr:MULTISPECIES: sensor histidine kinase [unclassified Cupriavidus]
MADATPPPSPSSGPSPEGCDACDAPAPVHGIDEVCALIEQVSHDLRSSLNAIQSWSYVLDRSIGTVAAPAQRALDGMRAGMNQQLALIEEMEEGVRLLADARASAWAETDLRVEAGQAIADKRPAAEARGVMIGSLECQDHDGEGGASFMVPGDSLRIAPLLRHLLTHCIWRAPAGGSVRVHLTAEADYVKFRITESAPLERSRGESRLAALSEFFDRRPPPEGGHSPRQSASLLLTRRMVEMQGAVLTAENQDCDSDNVSVCIAVRFPRTSGAVAA